MELVKDFAEIILCDGNSTDDTREIAHGFGARVIPQDSHYLDPTGRIKNFSGVWNQVRDAGSYDWFFCLCADEYIPPELIAEIRQAVAGEPAVYWMPRKYVYRGVVIECAITYPTQQYRVFHRDVTGQYVKEIHEHIEINKGVVPKYFKHAQLADMDDSVLELMQKWRRYIALERRRRGKTSLRWWVPMAVHEVGIAGLYTLRLVRVRLFCKGARLPLRFDFARIWYQFALVWGLFKTVRHF